MLFILLLALLGFFTAKLAAFDPATNSSTKAKRWYSPPGGDTGINTWPVIPGDPDGIPQQWVRYCYKDQTSADQLNKYVDAAIKMWQPAFDVSSLNIQLDPATGGSPSKFCDELATPENPVVDALVISSQQEDCGKAGTSTSVGYDYTDLGLSMRHSLDFCDYSDGASDEEMDMWVLSLAHELGHAIGLVHEHQRPDRDDFVKFKCENVVGYDDALAAAEADDEEWFPKYWNMKQRMEKVCSDIKVAADYFPFVTDYIRGDNMASHESIWSTFGQSSVFDYQSIMIYGSHHLSRSEDDGNVLVLEGIKTTPRIFFMGGNPDPTQAQLSAGDIARVAQLYRQGTYDGTTAMNTATWSSAGVLPRRTAEPSTIATVTMVT